MLLGGFISTPDGYLTELDDEVALILQQLLGETITVLDAPSEQSFLSAIMVEDQRDEPEDPTLRILLPSMSEDPTEAQSLRAMTEDALRTQKSKRLEAIGEALSDIVTGASTSVLVPREPQGGCPASTICVVLAQHGRQIFRSNRTVRPHHVDSQGAAETPPVAAKLRRPNSAGRPGPSADVPAGGFERRTRWTGRSRPPPAPHREAAGARSEPPSIERSHALGNEINRKVTRITRRARSRGRNLSRLCFCSYRGGKIHS